MKKFLRRQVGALFRNNPLHVQPQKFAHKDLLDIGPGRHLRDEFITVDYQWRGGLDVCWDITQGLPLDHQCVSGVYSEHCIEHIPLVSGDRLIGEIFRVLKPGGRVRLVVPDAEMYLTRYVHALEKRETQPLPYADRDVFEGIYQPIISVNRIFHDHGHQFLYDRYMLRSLLERHGFVDIEQCEYLKGHDNRLLIDTEKRAHESLYMEAVKPA